LWIVTTFDHADLVALVAPPVSIFAYSFSFVFVPYRALFNEWCRGAAPGEGELQHEQAFQHALTAIGPCPSPFRVTALMPPS
jgi:hypothetical protein